ncbi:MAG: biotin/lipoyl-binding protein [Pseudodonghicola sp.]|nr:biotin/lipoyl-binding protein [Pseudodonghicola sp.]
MARTEIAATVTGSVWEVLVKVGDRVNAGDDILIAEAMKMEIGIASSVSGTVVEIRVESGAEIEEGATVAVIEG